MRAATQDPGRASGELLWGVWPCDYKIQFLFQVLRFTVTSFSSHNTHWWPHGRKANLDSHLLFPKINSGRIQQCKYKEMGESGKQA